MKCLIVYFSATGNTLYGTRLIQAGLKRAGSTGDRVSARDFSPEMIEGYDLLGFACPVFAFQPALPLLHMLELLPPGDGRPVFTFLTKGGEGVNAGRLLRQRLGAKDYAVIAHTELSCEESWTTVRFAGKCPGKASRLRRTRKR